MSDLRSLDDQLNQMTRSGQIIEALRTFYAVDATFREGNQPPRIGRDAQQKHLESFFATLKHFNGATLHASAVAQDVSISEWTFDMTGPDGPIVWNEVLVRRWRDGKVVAERFYAAS